MERQWSGLRARFAPPARIEVSKRPRVHSPTPRSHPEIREEATPPQASKLQRIQPNEWLHSAVGRPNA
eukprot:7303940-Alexandrium_andersonii.AAC.1